MTLPELSPAILASLNPNIRRTVAWLRSLGFDTCDSGDGATHDHPCDRPYPFVSMRVRTREMTDAAHDLAGCLKTALRLGGSGVRVVSVTEAFALGETPSGVCIQVSYDPEERTEASVGWAVMDVMGMHDGLLKVSVGA